MLIKVVYVFTLTWSCVLVIVCLHVCVCTRIVLCFSGFVSVCTVMFLCFIVDSESKIRSGVDVVVGTPGRIMDFLERGTLDLRQLRHVVLDEVDRMLDMGFADSVDEILRHRYRRGV